jgi:hypothetical protein
MSTDAWPKHFSQRTPKWVAMLFGVIFAVVGVILLVVDFEHIKTLQPSPFGWAGLAVLIGGPLLAWVMYHFRTDIDLTCNPDGFTLVKESRKGRTEEMYLWSDVAATKYWETESTSGSGDDDSKKTTTITSWYQVEGPEGSLFQVTGNISRFDDLIRTFNDYATSVPYRWEAQTSFQLSVAGFNMSRARYVQVPRVPATS